MASNRKFNVPVNLVSLSTDPASADEGDIYYNTDSDVIRLYANGSWTTVGGGGGTASDSFKTIAVSGQDNVVADSSTDTLTLVAGTNVSITTNATTDSITINSAGTYTNVDSITYPDYITFDTTPETVPTAAGSFFWDSGESAPAVILNANVELKLGQEEVVLVKNATGSSIPKGSVVYINGAAGQRPTIALSDADTEATSSKTLGLTAETIADTAEGFVTTFGVLRGVNTDGLSEGAMLWLSSTAGGYTTSIPAEPAHLVFIGYVVKASETAGEIFVNPQNGYELNELHGVQIEADGSLTDNEVVAYDTASGLWKNQTASEAGLAVTAGTLAQFASTTSSELAGVVSDETGTGSLVFSTAPTFETRITISSAENNSIEIGRLGASSTPFIDFHSGPNNIDYDSRIIANGGGTTGTGSLSIIASDVRFTGTITFEGSSDDANETTLTVTNPTADRTITLPDESGTVALLSSNNAFTGANTFINATGQTFRATSTSDGIIIDGNGAGSSSYAVTLIPQSLTGDRTIALPNNSGTLALAELDIQSLGLASYSITDGTYVGKVMYMTSSSSINITVQNTDGGVVPIGSQINIIRAGTGSVTVSTGGTAPVPTVNATPGLKLRAQWSMATLIKVAEGGGSADTWVLVGDISA